MQIPVRVQGYIDELREQIAGLSDRCGELAGLKAEADAQNAALTQSLAKAQTELAEFRKKTEPDAE